MTGHLGVEKEQELSVLAFAEADVGGEGEEAGEAIGRPAEWRANQVNAVPLVHRVYGRS